MSNNSEDVVINRTLKGIFIKSFMRDHDLDKERMRALLKDYIYSGQKISLKDFLLKSIGKETSKMKAKKLKKFVSAAETKSEKKELAFNFNPDVIKRMLQMSHLFSSIDSDNIDQFTIVFKCRPKNMLSTEIPDTLFLGLTKLAKRTNYSFCVVCEPKLIRFCFTESM